MESFPSMNKLRSEDFPFLISNEMKSKVQLYRPVFPVKKISVTNRKIGTVFGFPLNLELLTPDAQHLHHLAVIWGHFSPQQTI